MRKTTKKHIEIQKSGKLIIFSVRLSDYSDYSSFEVRSLVFGRHFGYLPPVQQSNFTLSGLDLVNQCLPFGGHTTAGWWFEPHFHFPFAMLCSLCSWATCNTVQCGPCYSDGSTVVIWLDRIGIKYLMLLELCKNGRDFRGCGGCRQSYSKSVHLFS